jgi:hypothetical protein
MIRCSFRLRSCLLFSLLLLAGVHGGFAQTSTATVSGTVVDVTGASIANADVTVLNTGTGISRQAKSDENGRYFVNSLIPGSYQVTGELPGFSKKILKDITLNVGAEVKLDVLLSIGEASTVVEVQAAGLLIDTQGSANGTVIDNKALVELPVVNRQFYSLALLAPGVAPPGQSSTLGFRGGFNVAGASEISNQFTLNGTFNNDMGVGQPSFRPSLEVIQEFKLLTGVYPAEYGRMSGGQLNIITKSGTNKFHGSVYEYLRNQATDAKPFFTAATAKTPALRQNTFGGTIGGPIFKDRTFFFFGYEGQRIGRAVTALATVPTSTQLNGVFTAPVGTARYNPSTGALLTPTSVSGTTATYDLKSASYLDRSGNQLYNTIAAKAGQQIANLGFPTTAATAAGTNNYNFSETRVENMNEESLRIDHKFSDKDSVNGTWNYFRDPAFEPSNTLCSAYVVPKAGCYTDQHSTLANIVYDRILTPNLVNELRLGFQRLVQPRIQEDNTAIAAAYTGLPGGPYFNQPGYANNLGIPNTSINGYATIGGATNLPQDRWDNHYQIVDAVTWNHGKHTVKAGIDFIMARSTNIITSTGRGSFSVNETSFPTGSTYHFGDALGDFLLGYVTSSTLGSSAPTVYLNFQSYHGFLQDDWKVTPYLTINAGLRYELDRPVYSPHNTVSTFNTAAGLNQPAFIAAGPSTFSGLYNIDKNNFAPRLGFALQPFSKDTTVLKGAFGIFYNMPLLYNQFLTNGTQFPFRSVATYSSTTNGSVSLAAPFSPPSVTSGVTPTTTPCAYNVPASEVYFGTGTPSGSPDDPKGCLPSYAGLSIARRYATPYIAEWSLGVQQALTSTLVSELTYFGSKGTKLPLSVNLNQINTANVPLAARTAAARPYPGFGGITSQDTRSNSNYHSLQASLRQAASHGIAYQMSYTYAKSIDGGGGIGSGSSSSGNAQNVYNLRAERALSDFDIRHRFVFSPVAELPFGKNKRFLNHGLASVLAGGFQVSSIFTVQSGRPFTINSNSTNGSRSFTSVTGGADRPNIIGDPNAGPKTAASWFNTAAFATPVAGSFGTSGRNNVVGPRYTELDATLSRNFGIYEGIRGQFRAEGFNIFNHPNLFNPSGSSVLFGNAAFGTITQANDNREFQFGLRILF